MSRYIGLVWLPFLFLWAFISDSAAIPLAAEGGQSVSALIGSDDEGESLDLVDVPLGQRQASAVPAQSTFHASHVQDSIFHQSQKDVSGNGSKANTNNPQFHHYTNNPTFRRYTAPRAIQEAESHESDARTVESNDSAETFRGINSAKSVATAETFLGAASEPADTPKTVETDLETVLQRDSLETVSSVENFMHHGSSDDDDPNQLMLKKNFPKKIFG